MISAFMKAAGVCAFAVLVSLVCACGSSAGERAASTSAAGNLSNSSDPLTSYTLTGNTHPVHDPSIIRQG
ncbi:MAG TPA: hypothetical protein VHT24_05120, partial [Pseudacidobacterium sp.]|nr:hypothetical protein [Pseudacidobacterium sp.]